MEDAPTPRTRRMVRRQAQVPRAVPVQAAPSSCAPPPAGSLRARGLCLSIRTSTRQSWNPGWSVATVARAAELHVRAPVTTGAVVTTRTEKERLAKDSVAWNKTHGGFKTMFPELDARRRDRGRGKKGGWGGEGSWDDAGGLAAKVDTLGLD